MVQAAKNEIQQKETSAYLCLPLASPWASLVSEVFTLHVCTKMLSYRKVSLDQIGWIEREENIVWMSYLSLCVTKNSALDYNRKEAKLPIWSYPVTIKVVFWA